MRKLISFKNAAASLHVMTRMTPTPMTGNTPTVKCASLDSVATHMDCSLKTVRVNPGPSLSFESCAAVSLHDPLGATKDWRQPSKNEVGCSQCLEASELDGEIGNAITRHITRNQRVVIGRA
jgi:hypothetical protein